MSKSKLDLRVARKKRIRKNVLGTSVKPRLSVYRSLRYVYVQLIDDLAQKTLASSSSLNLGAKKNTAGNRDAATKVGVEIAQRAKELNIKEVVFDRNGFLYHGVVKNLADAARKEGLRF